MAKQYNTHIYFLTTANLATNPRLLKELDYYAQNNKLTVLLCKLGNWSDKYDAQLRIDRPDIHFIELDITRTHFFTWLFWAILEKCSQFIYPLFSRSIQINSLANSRRAFMLLNSAKKLPKPHLIIAHNLGALYPAYALAKRWKIPFTFDIEDYHPGESITNDASNEKKRREFLFKKLLPQAKALTSASTLIGEHTLALIGGHPKHQVIINSFPQIEFQRPEETGSDNTLRLVWFSQTISFGRGIEQLFEALTYLETEKHQIIKVTLIGYLDPLFDKEIIQRYKTTFCNDKKIDINLIPPLSQTALNMELTNHDIGLALEFNSSDLNRQLCLTNKIIAYAQAGLYVLATDTLAQTQFIQDRSDLGLLCKQTPLEMSNAISLLSKNITSIKSKQLIRFEYAEKHLSWDIESKKLQIIESLINV